MSFSFFFGPTKTLTLLVGVFIVFRKKKQIIQFPSQIPNNESETLVEIWPLGKMFDVIFLNNS